MCRATEMSARRQPSFPPYYRPRREVLFDNRIEAHSFQPELVPDPFSDLVIHPENPRRGPSGRRQAPNFNAGHWRMSHNENEMVRPSILSRVKEANDSPSFRIDSGEIRSLLPIARPTGERQIVKLREAAMLLCDDMLNVKRASEGRFGNPAILAESSAATADLAS